MSFYNLARSCGTGWFDVGYLCGQGEGDCDWDSDCLPGLVCDYDMWLGEDDCVAGRKICYKGCKNNAHHP